MGSVDNSADGSLASEPVGACTQALGILLAVGVAKEVDNWKLIYLCF